MGQIFQRSCALLLLVTLPNCAGPSDPQWVMNGGGAPAGASSVAVSGAATGGAAGASSAGAAGTGSAGLPPTHPTDRPGEVGGCKMFPAEDDWNLDISAAAVDPALTQKVQALVGGARLHPDYGRDGSELYGIPLNIVPQSQPLVAVTFEDYLSESDPGPYPFPGPREVIIEGNSPESCVGDCHLLVVQQGACLLYEGYACEYRLGGWRCANGAKWDLTKVGYGQRPVGWTSADAAGLAIAPGLLRYAEVRAGEVNHALRFTLSCTADQFVKPATHRAVPACDPSKGPPMGTRVRLKADYDVSKLSRNAQVVLTAMKKHGMILADNGSNFYFQGEANAGWTEDDIEPLKSVPASAFEVVVVP